MQDPTQLDIGALTAANTLAQQRMAMFKEDGATALKVTKKPAAKGKGDGQPQASCFLFGLEHALVIKRIFLYTHRTDLHDNG